MKDSSASSIQINFKEVCYTCRYRDTYLNEDTLYGDNKSFAVGTVIGCRHEKICKYYLADEE